MSVQKLVKIYQEGAGSDDVAVTQLQNMGNKARDELIQMLDDPRTSKDDAGTVIQILFVCFRSEDSIRAMDRYGSRMGDAKLRELLRRMQTMMRENNPRKF